MKKIFLFLFSILVLTSLFAPKVSFAEDTISVPEGDILISVFVRDDCKHCKAEKEFFAEFVPDNPNVQLNYLNLDDEENQRLFTNVAEKYELLKGTPITLVGDTLFQGFDTGETTGKLIEDLVNRENIKNYSMTDILDDDPTITDSVTVASSLGTGGVCTEEECVVEDEAFLITLPLLGKTIDVGTMSITSLSLVLGLVDGFNPCAMWVLVMFLLVLSQLKDRKRMWQYAGLFILAEAVMYYLILNVWFTAWDFIALNRIVTPLVGLLALGSGVYFMYKFFTFKPECNVASLEQQQKMSDKVKSLAARPLTFGVALGILGLAFSVNIFEFACSIGIPQAFTKILELNAFDWLTTQWYMFLYILMYMFDDFVVFGIALYGMEKLGVVQKYSKWTTLIGGILMLLLGVLMLLRPELLVL